MNFLDVNVYAELKRRNYLREAKAEKEKSKKAAEKKKKRQSLMRATALGTPMGGGNAEDDAMDIVGAEADDAEAEFIQQVGLGTVKWEKIFKNRSTFSAAF